MIDIRTLKQLIKLMKDNDLSELDLRDQDEQVTLKRGGSGAIQPVMAQPVAAPVPGAPAAAAAPQPAPAADAAPAQDESLVEIPSPMVGTFYSSSSPDADAFVTVGSPVSPDTVVCLVEAMKVFNEIKPEGVSGKIEKILVASGEAVEFGQALFLVRPD